MVNDCPAFDKNELIPVVVQSEKSGKVLMMAYMNQAAFEKTIKTKQAHFYSRSRKKLWKKGEESGHTQEVKEIRVDCDGDTIVLQVEQKGPGACHKGYKTCFYRTWDGKEWKVSETPSFDPKKVYDK